MKKKNISLLLAGAMTLGMATSAFAVDEAPTKEYKGNGDKTTTIDANVDLNGTIGDGEVLLSVVMPTVITFTVATAEATETTVDEKGKANAAENAAAGSRVYSDISSGTGTVTNNSNVAIKLEISDVVDNDGLLTKMDLAVTSDKLKEAAALANPLTSGSTGIVLADSIAAKDGTTQLKVVGQAAKGQFSGIDHPVNLPLGDYSVTTTMKVSVANA